MDKGFDRIVDELKEREEQGRELDVPEDRRQTWMDAVSTYANDFLDTLEGRKAYESEGYDRTPEDSGFEVGEKGADMDGEAVETRRGGGGLSSR